MFAPYKREPRVYRDFTARIVVFWFVAFFVLFFLGLYLAIKANMHLGLSIGAFCFWLLIYFPETVLLPKFLWSYRMMEVNYALTENAIVRHFPNGQFVSIPYGDISSRKRTRMGINFQTDSGERIFVTRNIQGGLDGFLAELDRLSEAQALTQTSL